MLLNICNFITLFRLYIECVLLCIFIELNMCIMYVIADETCLNRPSTGRLMMTGLDSSMLDLHIRNMFLNIKVISQIHVLTYNLTIHVLVQ